MIVCIVVSHQLRDAVAGWLYGRWWCADVNSKVCRQLPHNLRSQAFECRSHIHIINHDGFSDRLPAMHDRLLTVLGAQYMQGMPLLSMLLLRLGRAVFDMHANLIIPMKIH